MGWHMGYTFAEKFEAALAERREREPGFGLRTLARTLARDESEVETIRRRLHKYRPKPNRGGAGEVAPTAPTRWEIEEALGLERDALAADKIAASADTEFLAEIAPLRRLFEIGRQIERGEIQVVQS